MKVTLTLIGLFLISTTVVAQDYNKGLKKELADIDEMYPAKKTVVKSKKVKSAEVKKVETVQEETPVIEESSDSMQVAAQPIGPQLPAEMKAQTAPVQNIQQQPVVIIQQPTTNVEANTVKESRAEQLRKQREDMERQNEMKLIERLEDERLNAEKERTEKLLSPINTKQEDKTVAPQAIVIQTQPEIVPAGAQVQQQQTQQVQALDNGNAIKAAIVAEKIEENHKNKYIAGFLGGIGNYPAAGNVSGAYALGGSFEVRFPNRIGVESSVAYSSYDVKNSNTCPNCVPGTPLVTTMNQWDFTGGFNYTIFKSTISPVVGALLEYTRRDYSSRVTYGYGNPSFTGSNAFSGGFQGGVEIQASENLVLGASLRYMMNISYRTDNPLAYYNGFVYNVGTPIESLSYYLATLNTKITF